MASNTAVGPTLDHIVLLVPHLALSKIPSWLSDALTVSPGGQHAGGLTENVLILFQDGVYIEIIAFVPGARPEERRAHRWGQLAEGQVIDWALSLLEPAGSDALPEARFAAIQERVRKTGTGLTYQDPVAGGRVRPDGVELKWAVAAPDVESGFEGELSLARGELPFWCFDRTARDLRVPFLKPENVKHPSGAVGVAGVTLSVRGKDKIQRLRKAYDAIFDEEAKLTTGEANRTESSWTVHVPVPQGSAPTKLVVKELTDEELSAIKITQMHDETADLLIELSLYTKGEPGTIRGFIGKGLPVKIELIRVD